MDALVKLLAAILGARVIEQYIALCDCSLTIVDGAEQAAKLRASIRENDGKCEHCNADVRMFGMYDMFATEDGKMQAAGLIPFDVITNEPTEN